MDDSNHTASLVSGIMIFLNAERFMEEAIESVLAQTYPNWELILVDDGSSDRSTQIALAYAEKHPEKIRYLEHEGHQNRGMSAARNLGIKNAKGNYIAFLDADDIWLPQKLERQVATLESQPEAMLVCGRTQWWYSWTGHPQDQHLDNMREVAPDYNRLYQPPTLFKLLLQNQARTPATCGVLMRREIFAKTGFFEESFRGMYEDQAFFAKAYLQIPVYVTNQCWDWYRQHAKNHSVLAEQSGFYNPLQSNAAHFTFLTWLSDYLRTQGIRESELWEALIQAMLPYRNPMLYYLTHPLQLVLLVGRSILPKPLRHWLWVQYQTTRQLFQSAESELK
ncbi:MAG: hypothetical protein Kow00121_18360 [Elainellaceae cyanobacterium]